MMIPIQFKYAVGKTGFAWDPQAYLRKIRPMLNTSCNIQETLLEHLYHISQINYVMFVILTFLVLFKNNCKL